jgi:hypothetical protein
MSICQHAIGFDSNSQPHTVADYRYRIRVGQDIRQILAKNAAKLAPKKADGTVNTTAFGTETKIETGGAQRVLSAHTNVGIELVQQIARRYGFAAWQLLVPDFDPQAPPVLKSAPPAARVPPEVSEITAMLADYPKEKLATLRLFLTTFGPEAGGALVPTYFKAKKEKQSHA